MTFLSPPFSINDGNNFFKNHFAFCGEMKEIKLYIPWRSIESWKGRKQPDLLLFHNTKDSPHFQGILFRLSVFILQVFILKWRYESWEWFPQSQWWGKTTWVFMSLLYCHAWNCRMLSRLLIHRRNTPSKLRFVYSNRQRRDTAHRSACHKIETAHCQGQM